MADSYKKLQISQIRSRIAEAAKFARFPTPSQGWIRTMRSALGMPNKALASRLGTTPGNVTLLERSEREGRATIKSLREAAEAMGCRFVYAIVPPEGDSVESLVEARAERLARRLVRNASVHMALEAQELGRKEQAAEVRRLKKQLMDEMPRNFWDPLKSDD